MSTAHDGAGKGTVSAFAVSPLGSLTSIGDSPFADLQTAPCWVEISHDGRYLFAVNTAVATISRFSIAPGGALTLLVEGAHAPLIQHLAPIIIERVNRFFGYEAINRVVFKQGKPPATAAIVKRPDLRPVPKELGEGIREIADPELRACLESLASQIVASNGPPSIGVADDVPLPEIIRSK